MRKYRWRRSKGEEEEEWGGEGGGNRGEVRMRMGKN